MNVLKFEREGAGPVEMEVDTLVVAGWTGRNDAGIQHHIEELAAIGVPGPSSVPVFYRNAASNVLQTDRLEVLGPDTSGEAEPVIVSLSDGLWLAVGSDHTDRKAETIGIALSKQLCGKVLGSRLWQLNEVVQHWDELILRAYATIDGERVTYQEGRLSLMRKASDLMTRYAGGPTLPAGTIMMCGTIPAIGGIRPAERFEMEIEDPVLGRRLSHSYRVDALPVVS